MQYSRLCCFIQILALTLALGACGGGGGGGNQNGTSAAPADGSSDPPGSSNTGDPPQGGDPNSPPGDPNSPGGGTGGNGGGVSDQCPAPGYICVRESILATPEGSYLAISDAGPAEVTLPATADLPKGYKVRVKGSGLGGWKIKPNTGQMVKATSLGVVAGATWTARVTPPGLDFQTVGLGRNRNWLAVASSADGKKLVAAEQGGYIYTSSDYGVSWMARPGTVTVVLSGGNSPVLGSAPGPTRNWASVASSGDGTKLVAVVDGGYIYTWDDSDGNWKERYTDTANPPTKRAWVSVASSESGKDLVAAESNGFIYTSNDYGQSWVSTQAQLPDAQDWRSVAMTADGSLVAVVGVGTYFRSGVRNAAGGYDWHDLYQPTAWLSVALSANGFRGIAAQWSGPSTGTLWVSNPAEPLQPVTVQGARTAVACSADGSKMVAVGDGSVIYSDSGGTWNSSNPLPPDPDASSTLIRSVASSGDGTRLVMAVGGGKIYTSSAWTSRGQDGGSISSANPDGAIELIYLGDGMFDVVSHEGNLTVQ